MNWRRFFVADLLGFSAFAFDEVPSFICSMQEFHMKQLNVTSAFFPTLFCAAPAVAGAASQAQSANRFRRESADAGHRRFHAPSSPIGGISPIAAFPVDLVRQLRCE